MRTTEYRRPAKQDWTIGQIVNVGFLRGLQVVAKEPTPGDFAPDAYLLKGANGTEYRFVPHRGIERVQ